MVPAGKVFYFSMFFGHALLVLDGGCSSVKHFNQTPAVKIGFAGLDFRAFPEKADKVLQNGGVLNELGIKQDFKYIP